MNNIYISGPGVRPMPAVPPKKIEAVVVCVDYADFLAFTLPTNRSLFDRMVIVTAPHDKRTQKLCEFWHVQTVVTDIFYSDGAKFNKAKGINEGLKALDGDGWVMHMDADIFLPPMFRVILQGLYLDPVGLYSIDRMMCRSGKDWLNFLCEPALQHEANIYVHPRPFDMGVRLAKKEYGGWVPLGFSQLWNQGVMKLMYPDSHGDAGRTDLQFSQLFPRDHRHMLAEIIGIHLETQLPEGGMGSNWEGRKTPPFMWDVLSEPEAIDAPEETPPEKPVATAKTPRASGYANAAASMAAATLLWLAGVWLGFPENGMTCLSGCGLAIYNILEMVGG